MVDIEGRLLRLATDNRGETWAALQRTDPTQAEWLKAISAEFGKPQAIELTAANRRYIAGTFRLATNYPDWQQRLAETLARIKRDGESND
jgi:hypothetical protein